MIFVSLISFNEANQIAHHNGGHGQVSNPEESFQKVFVLTFAGWKPLLKTVWKKVEQLRDMVAQCANTGIENICLEKLFDSNYFWNK